MRVKYGLLMELLRVGRVAEMLLFPPSYTKVFQCFSGLGIYIYQNLENVFICVFRDKSLVEF